MYEGKISPARLAQAAEGETLRMPEWAELVARLVAARELRQAMSARRNAASGNFERFACSAGNPLNQSERAVNLDDSTDGKGSQGTVPVVANNAASGERETQ